MTIPLAKYDRALLATNQTGGQKASVVMLFGIFVVCLLGLLSTMQVLANSAVSETEGGVIGPLISALRSTNNSVGNKAVEDLLSMNGDRTSYDLHLRRADFDQYEVKSIAEAIKTVHENGGPSLRSFSMSYNPNLGDEGVLVLVENLPKTITEIGLVQSGIGDKGGDALIRWAADVEQLRWLCIEQNTFSNDMKTKLKKLGQERSGLLVEYW